MSKEEAEKRNRGICSTHVKTLFVRSPNRNREDSDNQNLVFIEEEDKQ